MSELRQRAQKYRFWAQTPKDTKIEKSETVIPRVFAISFREKKVYSNRTTRSMRLVGVVQGRHINVSGPVYRDMKCGRNCLSHAAQPLVLYIAQHFMNQAPFHSTFPILVITKIFGCNNIQNVREKIRGRNIRIVAAP